MKCSPLRKNMHRSYGYMLVNSFGLLFVIVIFNSLASNLDVIASVSNNTTREQSLQQFTPNNLTSGAASDIYNTREFALENNIKNLFILIPNEGHHGPAEDDEARYLDQSFVPEDLVLSRGTNVVWFNGDVGHEHDIVVSSDKGSSSPIYRTGQFSEFEARNYTFNEIGHFPYADTVEYENGYVMRGNISVIDEDTLSQKQTSEGNSTTIGLLMIPTEAVTQHIQDLQNSNFLVDSMHTFPDLRDGNEQTLIVWTAPDSSDISTITTQLTEISQQLPYS
jgi:plastocyanin